MGPKQDIDRLTREWIDAVAADEAHRRERARSDMGVAPRSRLDWLLHFAYDTGGAAQPDPQVAWHEIQAARELVLLATGGAWEAEGGGHYAVRLMDTRGDRARWPKLPPKERARLELHRAQARAEGERGGRRVAVPEFTQQHLADLAQARAAVREVVEAVADGHPGRLLGGGDLYRPGVLTKGRASDDARLALPPAGFHAQVRVSWERDGGALAVRTIIRAKLADALRVAAVVLVSEAGASLVRRCRWRGCGRIFVARKGQRYCRAHQRAAREMALRRAQDRYIATHGRAGRRPSKRDRGSK